MDIPAIQAPPHQRRVIERFVAACRADERVVAALLVGSYASGAVDDYFDLDLYLLTSDEAYEAFSAGREAFIRHYPPLLPGDSPAPGPDTGHLLPGRSRSGDV